MGSSSRTSNSQSSRTDVRNLNVEGNEGITIADSPGSVLTLTDHGALDAAMGVGIEALRTGGDAFETAAGFAGRGLDTVIDFAAGSQSRAFDLAGDVLDTANDIFGNALEEQRALTERNITGLTALAKQTSESADDRVTRVVLIIVVAAAAAFILPKVFE